MKKINDRLIRALKKLTFTSPVTHVYNPLEYARISHDLYWERFGTPPREIVLVGMNPGPWGMAQTGVPFGEISAVRDWMGIETDVGKPENEHHRRPVEGFACLRSEVSGRRLWGWAEERFGKAEVFFQRFFVANYCPLVFMEESGRNRTPDKLKRSEKEALFQICDKALRETVERFAPRCVIGVGGFAETRIRRALKGMDCRIGRITHPSPANPKANRGWAACAEKEFSEMGVEIG